MKRLSHILELVIVMTATSLIVLGNFISEPGSCSREKRQMTVIGVIMLVAWVMFAAIPRFITGFRDEGELKQLMKNGFFNRETNNDKQNRKKSRKPNRVSNRHHPH